MLTLTTFVLVLSGLYGVYLPLALGALWATAQESSSISARLRILTICMFVLVTANLAFWIAEWAMWTLSPHYSLKTAIAGTVLTYVSACMPALTGSLSDGILAWRCYVTFGRPPWLKWALSFAIFANTAIGLVISFVGEYDSVAWAIDSLVINSVLTGSVVYKLVQLSKRDPTTRARSRVLSAGCILVEASFVSWLGVSAYFAVILWSISIWTKVDPPDNVIWSAHDAVSLVFAVLPMLFGVSQTLIVARTGLSRFVSSRDFESRVVALTTDFGTTAST